MSFISNLTIPVYQDPLKTEMDRAEKEMTQAWNGLKSSKSLIKRRYKDMASLTDLAITTLKNNVDGVCSNDEWVNLPRKIIDVSGLRDQINVYKSDVAKFQEAYNKAKEKWSSLKAQLESNRNLTTIFIPAHFIVVNNNNAAPNNIQNMNVNSIIPVAQPVVNNSMNANTISSNQNENNSSVAHSQNSHQIVIPIARHPSNRNNPPVAGIENRPRPQKRQKNTQ